VRPGTLESEDVAAFLRANPSWLRDNPELYRVLQPPRRLHGDELADHMAEMLARERAHAQAECARADSVLAAGRAAAGLATRVQDAVLALIRAPDPAEFVRTDLPALLAVDAACLCADFGHPGTRLLPAGTVDRLLGRREVAFREHPTDAALLHGSAAPLARVDALVRVGAGSLLALASRDRSRLHPGQGVRSLAFLGRALSAACER
jgi:uncharacterized protein YigA (DUF484 family)